MNIFSQYLSRVVISVAVALFSINSIAGIVITGTRVIYPSDAQEVSVKLSNAGSSPVLVQSWIDDGDVNAKPSAIHVPFVLTPPINRVEANKGQTLRISYVGGPLPMDRESIFWLNVLEVPAKKQMKEQENYLQMAFRSRIKLFYRPTGLTGNANDAAKAITWHVKDHNLEASNPTPFYISLVNLTVNGKNIDADIIAPHSTLAFKLPVQEGNKISGTFVNDYGAIDKFESVIK